MKSKQCKICLWTTCGIIIHRYVLQLILVITMNRLEHELWETLCSYINKIISLPVSGCIVSLVASFCSINPQYSLFLSFSMLFWWIKLSPYQHQCCIVSLIASFCSINLQYLQFLSIFLHAFLVVCQFEIVVYLTV